MQVSVKINVQCHIRGLQPNRQEPQQQGAFLIKGGRRSKSGISLSVCCHGAKGRPARRDLQQGQPAAGQPQPAAAAAFPLLLAPSRAAKLPARQRPLRGSHGDPMVATGMPCPPSLPPPGEEGREKAPFFLPGRPSPSAGVRPSRRRFAGTMFGWGCHALIKELMRLACSVRWAKLAALLQKNKAGDASRALQGVGTLGSTDVTAPSFGNGSFGHRRHKEVAAAGGAVPAVPVPKMLGTGGRT